MPHPDSHLLLQAIGDVWPQMVELVGPDWSTLRLRLADLLSQLERVDDPDAEALLRYQVVLALRPYPAALRTLLDRQDQLRTRGGDTGQSYIVRWTEVAQAEAKSVLPSPVTRYTDITCPRRVWVIYGRIAVTVGLTVDPSQFSAVAEELRLHETTPVRVRIAAPGFQVLGAAEQEIAVRADADSPPVVFYLHPEEVGHTSVSFDFSQQGNPLGTASVPVEITDHQVEAVSELRSGQTLHAEPGLQPADRILYVRWQQVANQPQLVFTLQQAGEVGSEYQPVPVPGDIEMYVDKLYGAPDTLRQQARRAVIAADEADRQLRAIGHSLWRDLIPAELRLQYAAARDSWRDSTLIVVSDEPYIPWELVWPYGEAGSNWRDDAPWCVTVNLTRWLRRTAQGRGNPGPPGRLALNALASLIPSDSGLPSAQKERDMLRRIVSQRGLQDLGLEEPTWSASMDLLEEGGYDWLHVAAHGNFHDGLADTGSVIRLQDQRELTPQNLAGPEIEAHIHQRRPGFFFNTCHGGRQGWAVTHLGGWAETLVSNGAGLFISPLWEVTDKLALEFATTFYQQLLAGTTVAEAVRAACQQIQRAGNPTWLAYSVYGHPNARLTAG